jgi:hypothetical protein
LATSNTIFKGYFPSVQLKKILEVLEELEELSGKGIPHVLRLFARRERRTQHTRENPMPYITILKKIKTEGIVDYNYTKHEKLDIKLLKKKLFEESSFDDMVVEELVVSLDKKVCLGKEVCEKEKKLYGSGVLDGWSPTLVAIFRRNFIGREEEQLVGVIRQWTDEEWMKVGGKLSTLDLVALQDPRAWAKGDMRPETMYTEVTTSPRVIKSVLWEIAQGDFPHIRQYVLGKTDRWVLTKNRPVSDWK